MKPKLDSQPTFDNIVVFKGFSDGRQYSMQSAGDFVEIVAKAAFEDTPVMPLYGKAIISKRVNHRSGLGKVIYNIDRYLLSIVAEPRRARSMLIIADQSDAYMASFIKPKALVIVVHDLHAQLLNIGKIEGPKPSRLGRLLLKANMRMWARADKIICVSENTRRDLLAAIPIDETKVSVIHNPLAMAVGFSNEDSVIAPSDNADHPGAVRILMVGAGKPLKNASVVVQVLDALWSQYGIKGHAVMVGQPGAGISEKDERVKWMSKLSRAELSGLYKSSTLLLMPSLYEGFGLPVIEAQAASLPVICSDRGALPEVSGKGALLVDPHNVEQICSSINLILTDPVLRQQLIDDGLANLHRFATTPIMHQYVEAFRSLASVPPHL